jgi:hypothetical protein
MSMLSAIGIVIFKVFIGVILCEAATEIFVASKILQKPRDLVRSVSWLKLLHDLITCGYCTSVWMGGGAAYLLKVQVTCTLGVTGPLAHLGRFEPLVFGFVMHRLSNWLHEHFSAKQKINEAQVFRTWYPNGEPLADPKPLGDGVEKKA